MQVLVSGGKTVAESPEKKVSLQSECDPASYIGPEVL